MSLLGIPRSKISYLNRLAQDLSIAEQLQLADESDTIRAKIKAYKDKQHQARVERKGKEKSNEA